MHLPGYEDAKRKSTGSVNLLENNKINKSIYALHNVVYALNANDSHVPYRESKLTRILRDSLGGKNKILMITCLVRFSVSVLFYNYFFFPQILFAICIEFFELL